MTVTAPSASRSGTSGHRPAGRPWWRSNAAVFAYVFVLPYLLLFTVFRLAPTLYGMGLSLADVSLSGKVKWVGLTNFQRLFGDGLFWQALSVTVLYTVIAIPLCLAVALAMASLVNRPLRGISAYRVAFFLPVVTSSVMSGVIFKWLYSDNGPLNALLTSVGLPPADWLGSTTLVLPSLAMVQAWTRFGYDMLILLAGMLAIPEEYYEAARDRSDHGLAAVLAHHSAAAPAGAVLRAGAGDDQLVPGLRPHPGDDRAAVRSGRRTRSTYMIYDQAFNYSEFGYGAAAGMVLLALILLISLIQNMIIGRRR